MQSQELWATFASENFFMNLTTPTHVQTEITHFERIMNIIIGLNVDLHTANKV